MNRSFFFWSLLIVTFGGLGLRLLGIEWGLPDSEQFRSVIHDEWPVLYQMKGMLNINLLHTTKGGSPIAYGYFPLIIYAAILYIAKLLGFFIIAGKDFYILHPEQLQRLYLIPRIISAMAGAFTVPIVYLIGQILFSRRVGIFSAVIIAFMPLHVILSHNLKLDVIAGFLGSIAIYYQCRVLIFGTRTDYLLTGMFLGLAASSTFSPILLGVGLLLAHFLGRFKNENYLKNKNRDLILSLFVLLTVFFLDSPPLLLHFPLFWDRIKELINVALYGQRTSVAEFNRFGGLGNWFTYHFLFSFPYALTWPINLTFILGSVFLLRKLNKKKVFLFFTFYLTYCLINVMRSYFLYPRYLLPIFSLLCVTTAWMLDRCLFYSQRRALSYLVGIVITFIFAYELIFTMAHLSLFFQPPAQIQAREWIRDNLPKNSILGADFWGKDFVAANVHLPAIYRYPFHLVNMPFNEKFNPEKVDYFILVDLQYRNQLRLCRLVPKQCQAIRIIKYSGKFKMIHFFVNEPRLGFFVFNRGKFPPDGWADIYPKIEIYERKKVE